MAHRIFQNIDIEYGILFEPVCMGLLFLRVTMKLFRVMQRSYNLGSCPKTRPICVLMIDSRHGKLFWVRKFDFAMTSFDWAVLLSSVDILMGLLEDVQFRPQTAINIHCK